MEDTWGKTKEKDDPDNEDPEGEGDGEGEGDKGITKDASGNLIDASGNKIDWKDSTSWVSFIRQLFTYLILTLLFGLFGSSFIYLTSRGSDLDNILPTDDLFYSAKRYQTQKKGASNVVDCNETSSGTFSVFEDNFPYNLISIKGVPTKAQLKELPLIERMINWFAKCVAGCFKSNRALMKGVLDNFAPNTPLGNHSFQICIAFPAVLMFCGFFSLVTGFWASFGAGVSADMKVTIWGGFLLYAWGLFIGLACIVCLRFLGTLLFYPMSQNWKEVANIMACNVKTLVVLFGFFACGSAYDSLDSTIAGMMGIVYLMLVAYTVWKYFSKQLF